MALDKNACPTNLEIGRIYALTGAPFSSSTAANRLDLTDCKLIYGEFISGHATSTTEYIIVSGGTTFYFINRTNLMLHIDVQVGSISKPEVMSLPSSSFSIWIAGYKYNASTTAIVQQVYYNTNI